MSESIKVVVRIRPMNTKQKDRGCLNIMGIDSAVNQVSIRKPDEEDNTKSFTFDAVFGEDSEQATVYEKTAFKLVENVIQGYNGTIFAYGQTGCGKTHSMVGKLEDQNLQGIIPRSFKHVLGVVGQATNKEFLVRCSFIEIYNEEVHDLLSKDVKAKLDVKETPDKGVFVKDLSMNPAKTLDELMAFMVLGNNKRSVGETLMNKDSSRSHSIFMLFIESAEKSTVKGVQDRYVAGKLNLVDLAGSQRISKTGAAGDRLKEAQKINLSLSALGNVISALVDGKAQHIPYRDSKLTRLLQDSLGGNTKTVMVANCSPADYNFDETLSTLRYASRAKFIKNKPTINEDPKDALLKEYADEIKRLKQLLENGGGGAGGVTVETKIVHVPMPQQSNPEMEQKLTQKEEQLNREIEEKKKLQEKIRLLQSQKLEAKDIHLESKDVEVIKKARQSLLRGEAPKVNPNQDQLLLVEGKTGKNSNQEHEAHKKLLKKYQKKVRELEHELKDITSEHYHQKEQLLEQIRMLSKESKFHEAVMSILLSVQEQDQLRAVSEYKEDTEQYRVPPFQFKAKKLVFPKLSQNQALELIKDQKQNRVIEFKKSMYSNKATVGNDSMLSNSHMRPFHQANNILKAPSFIPQMSLYKNMSAKVNIMNVGHPDYLLNDIIRNAKGQGSSEWPKERKDQLPQQPPPKNISRNQSLQPLENRPLVKDSPPESLHKIGRYKLDPLTKSP